MKHKTSGAPPQQEELRDSANAVKPLEASPVKEIREEQPIEHTFDCGDCEEVFESEVNLNTHIMKMMSDENDLACYYFVLWLRSFQRPRTTSSSVSTLFDAV